VRRIEKKQAAEHFDVEPTAPLRAVEFTLYGFAAPRVRSAVNPPGEGKTRARPFVLCSKYGLERLPALNTDLTVSQPVSLRLEHYYRFRDQGGVPWMRFMRWPVLYCLG